ncbi:mitochondrial 2-oxodicarboxylate carrier-like [Suricata suricatta]|uniref:mitochondrial 2-oxodicarboxylate carrier-like n=1 Tax=Suricata suricatta TaxID=37032 RepID=UPI001155FCAA|nr:mitochondrial 2-oxodicarboxylate carrier-like [Suricata suricatta]
MARGLELFRGNPKGLSCHTRCVTGTPASQTLSHTYCRNPRSGSRSFTEPRIEAPIVVSRGLGPLVQAFGGLECFQVNTLPIPTSLPGEGAECGAPLAASRLPVVVSGAHRYEPLRIPTQYLWIFLFHQPEEQPSTMSYARHIIKKEGLGLQGLYKGFTATLGRHGVFNMVYFGFYYNVKNIVPVNKDPTLEFLRKFGIGLLSGTIAAVINIPFDVAKSRIQGPQPVPGEIKYRTCFKTMATVYQEEGILALYKGLLPKIMRLGPGGAVMLLVYEYTYSWLQENW